MTNFELRLQLLENFVHAIAVKLTLKCQAPNCGDQVDAVCGMCGEFFCNYHMEGLLCKSCAEWECMRR